MCVLLTTIAGTFGQSRDKKIKSKKLSKSASANLTPEQKLIHETDRKTKGGKKKMSTKQKARIQKKQARAAKNTRTSGPQRSKPK